MGYFQIVHRTSFFTQVKWFGGTIARDGGPKCATFSSYSWGKPLVFFLQQGRHLKQRNSTYLPYNNLILISIYFPYNNLILISILSIKYKISIFFTLNKIKVYIIYIFFVALNYIYHIDLCWEGSLVIFLFMASSAGSERSCLWLTYFVVVWGLQLRAINFLLYITYSICAIFCAFHKSIQIISFVEY